MTLLEASSKRPNSGKVAVLWLMSILFFAIVGICAADPSGRKIEILNESGRNVVIEWVNPKNGELVTLSQPHLDNGAKISFDSFVNHTFMVHEPSDGACSSFEEGVDGSCGARFITVSDNAQQGMW